VAPSAADGALLKAISFKVTHLGSGIKDRPALR